MNEEAKEYAEQLISDILAVFDASDKEGNSEFVVWQVCIEAHGEKLECSVAFSEQVDSHFYHVTDSKVQLIQQVERQMEKINNFRDVTLNLIKDVYEYFAKNISSARYWTDKLDSTVVVKM